MDEFKAFQAKVQDQVKLELLKSHNSIKDSVHRAFVEKINNIVGVVNQHEGTINFFNLSLAVGTQTLSKT